MADNLTVRTEAGPSVGTASPEKSAKSDLDQRMDSLRARVSEKFGKKLTDDDHNNEKLKAILTVATARAARAERQSAQTDSVKKYEKSTSTEQLQKGAQNDGIALALGSQDKAEHGLTKDQARAVASDQHAPAMLPRAEAPQITAQQGRELAASILGMLATDDGPLTLDQFRDTVKQRPATLPGDRTAKAGGEPAKTDRSSQSDTSGQQRQQPGQAPQQTLSQLGQQVKAGSQTASLPEQPAAPQAQLTQTQTQQPTRPSSGDTSQQGQQQAGKQSLSQLGQQAQGRAATRTALPQSKSLATLTAPAATLPGARPGTGLPSPGLQTRAMQSPTRPANGDATANPAATPAPAAQSTPPSRTTPGQPAPGQSATPGQTAAPGQTATQQQKGPLGQLFQQAKSTPGAPAKNSKDLVGLFNEVVSQTDAPGEPEAQQPGPSRPNTPQQPVATRAAQTRPTNGDATADAPPTQTPTGNGATRPTDTPATTPASGKTATTVSGALGELFDEVMGEPDAAGTQPQPKPASGKLTSTTTQDRVSPQSGNGSQLVAKESEAASLSDVVKGATTEPTTAKTIASKPVTTAPVTTPPQQTTPRPGSQAGGFGSPITRAAPMSAETSGTRLSLRGSAQGNRTVRDGPTNLGGGLDSSLEWNGMHFNWDAFYVKFMAKFQKNEFKARQMMAELRDLMHELAVESIEARIALEKMNQAFERAEAAAELGSKIPELMNSVQRGQGDAMFGKDPSSVFSGENYDSKLNDLVNPVQADGKRGNKPLFRTDAQIASEMSPANAEKYRELMKNRDTAAGLIGEVSLRQQALEYAQANGGDAETVRTLQGAYDAKDGETNALMTRMNQNPEARAMLNYRRRQYNRAVSASFDVSKEQANKSVFELAASDPNVIGKINLRRAAIAFDARSGAGAGTPEPGTPSQTDGTPTTRLRSSLDNPHAREDAARITQLTNPNLITSAQDYGYTRLQQRVAREVAEKGGSPLADFVAAPGKEPTPAQTEFRKLYDANYPNTFNNLARSTGLPEPVARVAPTANWADFDSIRTDPTKPLDEGARRQLVSSLAEGLAADQASDFISGFRDSDHRYATDPTTGRLTGGRGPEGEPEEDTTDRQEMLDTQARTTTQPASNPQSGPNANGGRQPGQGQNRGRDQGKFDHQRGLRNIAKDEERQRKLESAGAISGVAESIRRDMEKAAAELTSAAQRGGSEVDQRLRSLYAQSQGLLAQMTQILNIGRSR